MQLALRGCGAMRPLQGRSFCAFQHQAKSFSGITLLELPPSTASSSRTVDIYECDLSSASRRLHYGWR